jgi:hypothetical protein
MMKKLILIILLLSGIRAYAMEASSQNTTWESLSPDIKALIVLSLTSSTELPQAISSITALATTNKELYAVINDPKVISLIIIQLSKNFSLNPIYIAALVKTSGAINWLIRQDKAQVEEVLQEIYKSPIKGLTIIESDFISRLLDTSFQLSENVKDRILTFALSDLTLNNCTLLKTLLEKGNLSSQIKFKTLSIILDSIKNHAQETLNYLSSQKVNSSIRRDYLLGNRPYLRCSELQVNQLKLWNKLSLENIMAVLQSLASDTLFTQESRQLLHNNWTILKDTFYKINDAEPELELTLADNIQRLAVHFGVIPTQNIGLV